MNKILVVFICLTAVLAVAAACIPDFNTHVPDADATPAPAGPAIAIGCYGYPYDIPETRQACSVCITAIFAYSDTGYSDSLLTATLMANPSFQKSVIVST